MRSNMTTTVENWAEQIRAGDVRALSRAVSAIENRTREAEELLRQLFPTLGAPYRVGITGAPGTGKSTLVDRLAAHYRGEKKTVGIIAVDPSSPFTGGAILGDRIRMQGHAATPAFSFARWPRAAIWAAWRRPPATRRCCSTRQASK